MKSKVIFMVVLLMGFGFLFTEARTEEQKSELFLIKEQIVKPAKIAELEAALKEMVAYCVEHNYQYSWQTYTDDNYRYYYLMTIKDLADIDNIMKTWNEIAEKIGKEKWAAVMDKYQKAYEYVKTGVIRIRPDLSYVPENPRLKPDEAISIRWGICYVKPDKTREFEEIMKKWVALFKEREQTFGKNISDGFNTFMGELGTDNPFYFWAEPTKSPSDYFRQPDKDQSDKDREKLRDEWKKKSNSLMMKTLSLLRNFENKGGMFRPELSYVPKKK